MSVVSAWKVTFVPPSGDPLVILDFGGETMEEFSFPWRQMSQKGNPVAGTYGLNYGRGNVTNGKRFTTVKRDHASNNAAKKWCLDLNLTLNAYSGVTGTLKVEIQGETDYYQMAMATLDDVTPRVIASGSAETQTEWDIGGCGWSKVTP